MKDRKPAYLVMCAAECLRACLAFSSLLPFLERSAIRANLLAAVIASPQLLIPLMWFYLWRDARGNAVIRKLAVAAKALSAFAGVAWASAFIIGAIRQKPIMDGQAIGAAAAWGLIVMMDLALAAASAVLARGLRDEEV